jgi:hypothetical protein
VNRHLNIFNFFNGSNIDYLEDNLSRAFHGEADVIPVKASEASTAAMPNARLLVIKDSGHMPQVEQPKIFFDAVETFLKGEFPKDAKKVEAPQEKK